jgi:pimeloyl-ACP methyl ester carboxylesterase
VLKKTVSQVRHLWRNPKIIKRQFINLLVPSETESHATPQASDLAPPVDECAYRYNQAATDPYEKATYALIKNSDFPLRHSIYNDYEYYMDQEPHCSPIPNYSCLQNKSLLTYYMAKVSGETKTAKEAAKEAIILIHGNSVLPENFFDHSDSYLNNAGADLFEKGYDIYAPYVTHLSTFQNARRRLASLKGESPEALDVKRILSLLSSIENRYSRIHLAGVSYGGILAVQAYRRLLDADGYNLAGASQKIGVVLSIEGYAPTERLVTQNPDSLFAWNWEMVYPGESTDDFNRMLARPNVYLAYGSCWENTWTVLLEEAPTESKIIPYQGPHEFKTEILLDVLFQNTN